MNFFERLNPRERIIVMAGGLVLFLLLVFFIIKFVIIRRSELSDAVIQAREDFNRIQRLKEDIQQLPAARNIPDVNRMKSLIFTRMEKHGIRADIRDRVETVSRTEERLVVDLNFKGLPLKNLIDFLHDVEFGGGLNLQVGRFTIQRSLPDREIYDGTISLTTIRPKTARR